MKLNSEQVLKLHQKGVSARQIAERYGVQPPAVHKVLRRLRETKHVDKKPKLIVRTSKEDLPESRYTQRDPCFWCGARGDVECGHTRT